MALYDSPVNRSYVVLTHTARPLFEKNGFKQVGNTSVPTNEISSSRVTPSAIYNKNLSGVKGISEAGYGQRYPYRGLSYGGAGSPRSSVYRPGLRYGGAGSPRTSVLRGLAYAGAGSPRASVYRPGLSYGGAGSPRTSILRDAYINDNPPPGTLTPLKGLRDDATPVDTGVAAGPTIPGQSITTSPAQPADSSGGFFSAISNAFGSVFTTAVASGTSAADLSVANAIAGASAPSSASAPKPITVLGKPVSSGTLLGMSTTTLLLIGAGVYFYMNK